MQAHKAGRKAGKGVRERNRDGNVERLKGSAASAGAKGKATRLNQADLARRSARSAVQERLRHVHAPLVIQLLPTATGLRVQHMWDLLVRACRVGSEVAKLDEAGVAGSKNADAVGGEGDGMEVDGGAEVHAGPSERMVMQTILVPGRHKMRVTLLPPPSEEQRKVRSAPGNSSIRQTTPASPHACFGISVLDDCASCAHSIMCPESSTCIDDTAEAKQVHS